MCGQIKKYLNVDIFHLRKTQYFGTKIEQFNNPLFGAQMLNAVEHWNISKHHLTEMGVGKIETCI